MWRHVGERLVVCRVDGPVPRVELWLHRAVRAHDAGELMNALYGIAGLVALGLFIYLMLALLFPEWFG